MRILVTALITLLLSISFFSLSYAQETPEEVPMESVDETIDEVTEEAHMEVAEEAVAEMSPKLIEHIVEPNQQLHVLAAYYLLNARRWPEIYEWNKDQIKNVNRVRVGQALNIWIDQDWTPPYDLETYMTVYRQFRK